MIDVYAVADILEEQMDFDYIEQEGEVLRFDLRGNSFWVYPSGSVDNINTWSKSMQERIMAAVNQVKGQ